MTGRVDRFTARLRAPGRPQAERAQAILSAFVRDRLPRLLEDSAGGETLVLDRLNLDLGAVRPAELVARAEAAVRRSMAEALRRGSGQADEVRASVAARDANAELRLRLETGRAPAPGPALDLAALLARALQADPPAALKTLKGAAANPHVAERLKRQLPAADYAAIMNRLRETEAADSDLVAKAQAREPGEDRIAQLRRPSGGEEDAERAGSRPDFALALAVVAGAVAAQDRLWLASTDAQGWWREIFATRGGELLAALRGSTQAARRLAEVAPPEETAALLPLASPAFGGLLRYAAERLYALDARAAAAGVARALEQALDAAPPTARAALQDMLDAAGAEKELSGREFAAVLLAAESRSGDRAPGTARDARAGNDVAAERQTLAGSPRTASVAQAETSAAAAAPSPQAGEGLAARSAVKPPEPPARAALLDMLEDCARGARAAGRSEAPAETPQAGRSRGEPERRPEERRVALAPPASRHAAAQAPADFVTPAGRPWAFAPLEDDATETAGLVLLWPFLPRHFAALGLIAGAGFVDAAAQRRAALLLHRLAAGACEAPEHRLLVEKTLCGLGPMEPTDLAIAPTPEETEQGEELLAQVRAQWPGLAGSSNAALSETFIARSGRLKRARAGAPLTLEVAPGPFDMLIDRISWPLSVVRLAWMREALFVKWR